MSSDVRQGFTVEFFEVDYDNLHQRVFPEHVQRVLTGVNRKVAANESLDAVMNFLFDATIDICPCDRIGLAFVVEEGRRVLTRWSKATYAPLVLQDGFIEDLHLTTRAGVVDKVKVRLIHDLPAFAALNPDSESTRLLVAEGIQSSMTCPLFDDSGVIGMLMRHSRQPAAFTEQHVYQHLATAERLTQAVQSARRLEEFERLNQSYMEMLGFVSHELKSPLSTVNMIASLLLEGYVGELTVPQRDKIESIRIKVDYLAGLVREYLDLSRLEGGQMAINPVADIDYTADVLAPSLEIVEPQFADRNMTLDWTPPSVVIPVEVDPDLQKIVMVNLLNNAVKYGNRGGVVSLRVKQHTDSLLVAVENEGPGFPEEQKSRLFQKFSRLQTKDLRSRRGTGVGLYTCWRIIRLHGGRIWADSEHGQWARFSFEIGQPLNARMGN